jgi:hypothetical protein
MERKKEQMPPRWYALTAKARQSFLSAPTSVHSWIVSAFGKQDEERAAGHMTLDALSKLGPVSDIDSAMTLGLLHEPVRYCLSDAGSAWICENKGYEGKQGQALSGFDVGFDADGKLSFSDPGATVEDLAMMEFVTLSIDPNALCQAMHHDISIHAHELVASYLASGLLRPAIQWRITELGRLQKLPLLELLKSLPSGQSNSGWLRHESRTKVDEQLQEYVRHGWVTAVA